MIHTTYIFQGKTASVLFLTGHLAVYVWKEENSYQYVATDRSRGLTTDSYFRFYLHCWIWDVLYLIKVLENIEHEQIQSTEFLRNVVILLSCSFLANKYLICNLNFCHFTMLLSACLTLIHRKRYLTSKWYQWESLFRATRTNSPTNTVDFVFQSKASLRLRLFCMMKSQLSNTVYQRIELT